MLRDDEWVEIARRESHRQLKHPSKKGRVTVPGKLADDLAPGTLNSILKQADLKKE
jgi:predicted RNA binding protein YcfA (HicA-like mRNA interferase family)